MSRGSALTKATLNFAALSPESRTSTKEIKTEQQNNERKEWIDGHTAEVEGDEGRTPPPRSWLNGDDRVSDSCLVKSIYIEWVKTTHSIVIYLFVFGYIFIVKTTSVLVI